MKVYLAAFLIAFSILGSYYGLIDPQSPARRLAGEACRRRGSSTLDHGSGISISTGPASRLQEKRVPVNVAPEEVLERSVDRDSWTPSSHPPHEKEEVSQDPLPPDEAYCVDPDPGWDS